MFNHISYFLLTKIVFIFSCQITAYETEINRLDILLQEREQAVKNDQVTDEEVQAFAAMAGQRHLLKVYLDKMKEGE